MCYFPTPNTAHEFALRTRSQFFIASRMGWGGGVVSHTPRYSFPDAKKALRSRSARDRLSHLQVAHNHDEGRPRSRRAAALLVALA